MTVPLRSVIDRTGKMQPRRYIKLQVPDGDWAVVRWGLSAREEEPSCDAGGDRIRSRQDKQPPMSADYMRHIRHDLQRVLQIQQEISLFPVDSWEAGQEKLAIEDSWRSSSASRVRRHPISCSPYRADHRNIPERVTLFSGTTQKDRQPLNAGRQSLQARDRIPGKQKMVSMRGNGHFASHYW